MKHKIRILSISIIILAVFSVSTAIAGSYNRTNAVNYADTWAHDRNSAYKSYGSGCGCTDCTNYVSQALYNGGYPMRTGNWNVDSYFEWWSRIYLFVKQNSKTWSATDWFNTYLAQFPSEFQYVTSYTSLSGGDFFLLDLTGDGIPDHARFVVGNGYTSTNQADYTNGCGSNEQIPPQVYTLLINQHCVDRKHVLWNYNLPSSTVRWYYHVTW
ncbi:MAG: amidase domain-containing protein [Anaerolineaceae bacterium]|jgi:hypothetical protein